MKKIGITWTALAENLRVGIVLCLLILLSACQAEETPYKIPETQLVDILADIHVSEAAVQHLNLTVKDSMTEVYLNQILAIHEVPRILFEPEFNQLKKNPKKLGVIYNKVIERLTELKLKKLEKEEKKRPEK